AGDEEAAEDGEREQLGAEDERLGDRQRHQNSVVGLVGDERMTDEDGDERRDPHRQSDRRHRVRRERAHIRRGIGHAAGRRVDDGIHPRQPQAQRDDDCDDADDDADEAIGAFTREETEVEERPEEVPREELRHPCTMARMSRATGVKSCWSVTRWKRLSSDAESPWREADTVCSATSRPFDRMTARVQTFSTMSKRCVLKRIIRPCAANIVMSERKSRLALTSRPENGSSRTSRSGLWSSAAASSTRCRMPFENAVIVL